MSKKTVGLELRHIVKNSLLCLADHYTNLYGSETYKTYSDVSARTIRSRTLSYSEKIQNLKSIYSTLAKLNPTLQKQIAHGFALQMEITNCCENAYRSYRWRQGEVKLHPKPHSNIFWVITAHPTESRNPNLVSVLRMLQAALEEALQKGWENKAEEINSLIALAVRISITPLQKPSVLDEARYLCETVLSKNSLSTLLDKKEIAEHLRFRTWVGGDKDGHPYVDQKTLMGSLEISRSYLITYIQEIFESWHKTVSLYSNRRSQEIVHILKELDKIRKISKKDFKKITNVRKLISQHFAQFSSPAIHAHFSEKLNRLFQMFPALVVPLEIRESSELVVALAKAPSSEIKSHALGRMLSSVSEKIEADHVRNYVRSMIVSMTHEPGHLSAAARCQTRIFKKIVLPVVPLFETREALENSSDILVQFLKSEPGYLNFVKDKVRSQVEVMVGYSDSSKLSGVLASRVAIAKCLSRVEENLAKLKVIPLFFHGSGGSLARGGGSIEEQMSWLSRQARLNYKATLQGEIVARTFSSSGVLLSQISKVMEAQEKESNYRANKTLQKWSQLTGEIYEKTISNPQFLETVKKATIYSYLHTLNFGSRPAKRKGLNQVSDLRAIPWVMCWTQARVLMPNWWGLGRSWTLLSEQERRELKKLFLENDPLLNSFIKQLGFTLAKVELAVWAIYLDRLAGGIELIEDWQIELSRVHDVFEEITGGKQFLFHRPWLQESIFLRASYIDPLNLLQILALERGDRDLLRLTVTGISSGMLTTG